MRVTGADAGAGLEAVDAGKGVGAGGGAPDRECSRDGSVKDDSTPLPRGIGTSVCSVGDVCVCVCSWRLDEPMEEEFEYAARRAGELLVVAEEVADVKTARRSDITGAARRRRDGMVWCSVRRAGVDI